MTSSQKSKIALALALVLLGLSCTAAGLVIFRLDAAQTLISHTYEVEVSVGDLESSLTEVGRSRVAYVDSGTPESLNSFESAVSKVNPALARIRQLVADNSAQLALADRLESISHQRLADMRQAVELRQQGQSDAQKQAGITSEIARSAFATASITQQMRRNEDVLLEQRNRLSDLLFNTILSILAISFILSACMFWVHHHLLNRELHERQLAEDQLRQLSLQLMRVQDEEHRRFARELHDGLGQSLSAAKMMVYALPAANKGDPQINELGAVLDDALAQTRTISHLFHPPLLDEIGFASAAKWLIDGYAQRTGVAVAADIPDGRLPRNLELTLYRVLQEALNNIHSHSKSARAEVSLLRDLLGVTLRVKDYGRGIPSETLAAFEANGTHAGVGLLSMKERVREQSGLLEIRSHETGTEILVKIPFCLPADVANSEASESMLHPPLNLHNVPR